MIIRITVETDPVVCEKYASQKVLEMELLDNIKEPGEYMLLVVKKLMASVEDMAAKAAAAGPHGRLP